ncbi:hypothetical protein GCM10017688_55320 [Streptomyces ramulosus]
MDAEARGDRTAPSEGNNGWKPDRIPKLPVYFSDHAVPCAVTYGGRPLPERENPRSDGVPGTARDSGTPGAVPSPETSVTSMAALRPRCRPRIRRPPDRAATPQPRRPL